MREMESLIHELRAETYFGLVKLLKPGCRSIIVLVDEKSKNILLPQFACHIWPYRKFVFCLTFKVFRGINFYKAFKFVLIIYLSFLIH